MSPDKFDKLVDESMNVIPARFRPLLDNLVFVVEREPRDPGLLGLFEGRPLTERTSAETFSPPSRITIYQGPHERMATSPRHLRKLVEETIWHEVAHYFGLDEREVLRAEGRRTRLSTRARRRAKRL
jgi:predicted Zn-dependent protease with MMP-like domain